MSTRGRKTGDRLTLQCHKLHHGADAAAPGEGVGHCLHAPGDLLTNPIQQLAVVPDVPDTMRGRSSL